MNSRLHVITLVAAAAAVAAAAGCAPKSRRTADDTLVMVTDTPMTTADPRYTLSSIDSKLARLVAAGLTTVEAPDLEPQLMLAERMDRIDPVTIDFTLRADARFSDGTPVLARDVVATFQSVIAPDSKSMHHKGFSERFARLEALSERVVRFHLVEPLGTLLSDLDFGILSPTGLGAGPYAVRELTSTHALLEANPYYFGAAPKVPRVDLRFVRDASARLLMLVGGSADLLQNSVRMDLIEEVRGRPRVQIASSPSVILTYLMMNNADPILRRREVRQAIALALDRPSIIAAKFGGHARLASSLLSTFHWAYAPDLPAWDRDLPRARALLDAAGYPDPDGPGPRPRMKLVYKTSSDAFRVAVARVIAAQLAEVGIEVEVRSFEFATFFADVKKGSYQLASMQTSELNEPDYYYFYFHSGRIPDERNPDGGNRWRYRNPEVDRLTEAGRREIEPARRKPIYAEVQRIIATDLPVIPLWHEDNIVLSNADVQGYRMTPNARFIGLVGAWKR
ncbi:MAG TPA: ABC transporter substrate-binding protein [Kofleriaceae bacterium]|nr:ABC transporter substrate-binding protein [Kofleriaceae bacterium]